MREVLQPREAQRCSSPVSTCCFFEITSLCVAGAVVSARDPPDSQGVWRLVPCEEPHLYCEEFSASTHWELPFVNLHRIHLSHVFRLRRIAVLLAIGLFAVSAHGKAYFVPEDAADRSVLRCGFELGVWGSEATRWSEGPVRYGNNAMTLIADGDEGTVKSGDSEPVELGNAGCVTISVWTFVESLASGEAHVRANFLDASGVPIQREGKTYAHAEMVCRIVKPESGWTNHVRAIPRAEWPAGAHQIALKAYWESPPNARDTAPKGVFHLDEVVVGLPLDEDRAAAEIVEAETAWAQTYWRSQAAFHERMREEWPVGEWRETPPVAKECSVTGRAYLNVTHGAGNNHHIYFNRPNFSGDGRYLFFLSDRTDDWEVYVYDFEEERTRRLSDDNLDQFTRPSVDQEAPWLYYVVGRRELVRLNYLTQERESLYVHATPAQGDFLLMDMSRDSAYLGFLEIETVDRGADIQDLFVGLFTNRVRCAFWIYRTSDGAVWKAWEEQRSLQHLLFNPVDSSQLLYCHEGPWHRVDQRLWLMDLHGNNKRPVRYEDHPGIEIGHEFWMPDGQRIAYAYRNPHREEPFSVRIVDVDTDEETVVVEEDLRHFITDNTGARFVGDGPEAVKLVHVETGRIETLVYHGQEVTVRNTHYHPHPAFSPDGTRIVFCVKDGGANDVAILDLELTEGGAP